MRSGELKCKLNLASFDEIEIFFLLRSLVISVAANSDGERRVANASDNVLELFLLRSIACSALLLDIKNITIGNN